MSEYPLVSINFHFVADGSDDKKRTRDGSFKTSTQHVVDEEEEIHEDIQRSFDRLDRIDALGFKAVHFSELR